MTLHSTELGSGLAANTGSSVTAAVQNNSAWKAAVNDAMHAWMKCKPDNGEYNTLLKKLLKSSKTWVSTYVTHTNIFNMFNTKEQTTALLWIVENRDWSKFLKHCPQINTCKG